MTRATGMGTLLSFFTAPAADRLSSPKLVVRGLFVSRKNDVDMIVHMCRSIVCVIVANRCLGGRTKDSSPWMRTCAAQYKKTNLPFALMVVAFSTAALSQFKLIDLDTRDDTAHTVLHSSRNKTINAIDEIVAYVQSSADLIERVLLSPVLTCCIATVAHIRMASTWIRHQSVVQCWNHFLRSSLCRKSKESEDAQRYGCLRERRGSF